MDDSAIMCDEIAESYEEDVKDKLHNETNLNEKMAACKMQICFTCIFIDYYSIIDSCQYLLLSNKISNKTKKSITISWHT